MLEALHARLKAAYKTLPASVPSMDRAALHASLLERRRKLEVEEETLVLEGGAAGITILRRAAADPVVVLTLLPPGRELVTMVVHEPDPALLEVVGPGLLASS
jgi:hypothetical protein